MSMRDSVKRIVTYLTWFVGGFILIVLGMITLPDIISMPEIILMDLNPSVAVHLSHLVAISFGGWFLSPFLLDRENIEAYTGLGWLVHMAEIRIKFVLIVYAAFLFWHLPELFSELCSF